MNEAPVTTARYYIGDLCYVLNSEEWNTYCANYDWEHDANTCKDEDGYDCENCLEPEKFDWDNLGAERPYFAFPTAFGDGRYSDQFGNQYCVDSGGIGAIRVEHANPEKLADAIERGLGHIHEFDDCDGEALTAGMCEYDNGTLYFGTVEIYTAGDYEEDEVDVEDEDG
jgi:hypothetical protein